ncbi:hypothetical protein D9V37_09045 [Nocardioides mangrovicus]|uniref:Uncharacterized protein n=1 Tax=Nocardioides mangrovicus TaxID=2478913 RepID=A0A3L8P404_9ACTN|nr:hypothetical protein [Nocardioides mangrovicus]RLV50005.1 hypothetical protein D9V37_09045 [Nocardioides mangrovicus]
MSDDDALIAELREAVADGALVTDRAREAARAAFTWRTIDEELMDLVHDSAATGELRVRGAETVRAFGFQARDLGLEVELDDGVLTGQVIPTGRCRLTAVGRDAEPFVIEVDDSGFFSLPFTLTGAVRFVVEVGEDRLSTSWVSF